MPFWKQSSCHHDGVPPIENPFLEQAHPDQVNIEGSFYGYGKDLNLDVWAGLGGRASGSAPSRLRFERTQPPAAVDASLRFGVQLVTGGLGDIKLTVDLDSHTRVSAPHALPPLDASGHLALAVDLFGASARLASCAWRLGTHTTLELTGEAEHILADSPTLRLGGAPMMLDLDELGPMISALVPGTTAAGRVALTISPLTTELAALAHRIVPTTGLTITFEHVRFANPDTTIGDLGGILAVNTAGDAANFAAKISLATAANAGQTVHGLGVDIAGTTPVSPFVGGDAVGSVNAHVLVALGEARTPTAHVRGLGVKLEVDAPTALLLHRPGAAPLAAKLQLNALDADTPQGGASRVKIDIDARTADLAGNHLDARVHLATHDLWAIQPGETMRLPGADLTLQLTRAGDDYDIRSLELHVGKLVDVAIHGSIAAATSRSPTFHHFELVARLPRLAELLATLPAATRPPLTLQGSFEVTLAADGTVPQDEILARLQPPRVSLPKDAQAWRDAVQAYADFIGAWAIWFDHGLPCTAALGFKLDATSLRDANNDMQGLHVTTTFSLDRHGPRLRFNADVAEVNKPTPVAGAHVELDFLADGAAMSLTMAANVASLAQPPLADPLTDVHFGLVTRYRLGGNLALESLHFAEARHGLRFDASGVITKPFAIALERGWEQPGMPGVDVSLRFGVGYGPGDTLSPLTTGGPSLAGSIGADGTLRIVDGVATLAGELGANKFSYSAGGTSIEQMSGALPFELELLAGRREDALVIAHTRGLGGGLLSLRVANDDLRDRPARPAYYDHLRPYRQKHGLAITAIRQDPYEITDFRLDGRIEAGRLVADWISMKVLGGDIVGNLAVQVTSDASLRGDIAFQVSGLDASNFKLLHLSPGADSELDADFRMGFLFAPRQRDLTMNMNVTKIGSNTLDRFLQLLDPEGHDKKLQSTRDNLGWVSIDEVAMWVRYENLNMDLAYSTKIRIPFTQIGYHPIPRELLRRYSLSGLLDTYVQPYIDADLAPSLGWTHAR